MPRFQYEAYREDQTMVEDHVEADDMAAAMLALKEQGLIVASIRQVEGDPAEVGSPTAESSPTTSAAAEQLALQKQIDRVLRQGKSLSPALLAYAQELPAGKVRRRLEHVANQLEGSSSSHERGTGRIDESWIPLLSASATSGDPSRILRGIIDESQRSSDLRRRFAQALAYPLLLLAVLLAMMTAFSWWLIPAFEDMFADFEGDVPPLTEVILGVSEAIRLSHGLVILIPGLALAAIVAFLAIGPRSRIRDSIIRRIPFFRSPIQLSDRAQFTRCLADLIDAEVPVADALRISGRNSGQAALRQHANRLATEMASENAEAPWSRSRRPVLPQTVAHVLRTIADPRAAAQILRELSRTYDEQTSNRLAWISSVTSPVAVIMLGVVVGSYVVALFLPLINLIFSLSG